MQTKTYKLDPAKPDIDTIKQAAELVDSGKLVAFPTETVYGIACRVTNDCLQRLNTIKEREQAKFYTLHIPQKDKVKSYVPILGLKAKKLLTNAWPGPLTIVFELSDDELKHQQNSLDKEIFENLYKNSSIGIRCPDHPVAKTLLTLTKHPVVAPSANITAATAPTDAEQVLSQLNGLIDILLDAGPCKHKTSSTVVKIGKKGLEILRPGPVDQNELKKLSEVNFLFVCTGNTCRSPMAAGIFRKYLAEKLNCRLDQLVEKGYKVSSAGTMGMVGAASTAEAVKACSSKGVDINGHISSALSKKLVEQSDLIFAMCRGHYEQIKALCPDAVDKCLLLAENKDIPDPIGRPQSTYNSCADLIEKAVKRKVCELEI